MLQSCGLRRASGGGDSGSGGVRRPVLARGRGAPAGEVQGGVELAALALAVLEVLADLRLSPQFAGHLGPGYAIPVEEQGRDQIGMGISGKCRLIVAVMRADMIAVFSDSCVLVQS
jgi:hypothetical protein